MARIQKVSIGLLTGFINGLIGVGGTLLVPAMIHVLGTERKIAHGTSLAIILPISLISIFIYGNYGVMPYRIGLIISLGGLLGGYIGAKLLRRISTFWLKRIFALLMIYAGIRMLWY